MEIFSLTHLQYFQHLHDKTYHEDVYALPLVRKLSHLYSHLVKYSSSDFKRNDTYSDALACILSMANSLNLSLSRGFEKQHYTMVMSLNQVPKIYSKSALKDRYLMELGHIAKLIEGFDHVESLAYKETFSKHLIELLTLLLQMRVELDENDVDSLVKEYICKLMMLKKKNIFFSFHHNEDLSIPTYRTFLAFYNSTECEGYRNG